MRRKKLVELKAIIEELKTVYSEKVLNTEEENYLQTERYKVLLSNGKVIERERIMKGNLDGSASVIVPILPNREIITVIEPRVFTNLTVGVGFPAGYIEKCELPVITALRELREETGYVADDIFEVDTFYQDEGCSKALNHIFIATNCQLLDNQKLDKDEICFCMSFYYQELLELVRLGYIKGCNSKLALNCYKEYVRRRVR